MTRADYRPADQRQQQARHAANVQKAKRAGVTLAEYQQRVADGEKFCAAHGEWHHRDLFGANARKADGRDSSCRDARIRRERKADAVRRASGRPPIPSRVPRVPDPGPDLAPIVTDALEDLDSSFLNDPRRACVDVPTSLFFPLRGEDPELPKQVCRQCPFTAACLRWALAVGDDHAVLAATLPEERRAMRRDREVAAC